MSASGPRWRFWWMTADDPPDLPVNTRAFRINPPAKSAIANFLAKCQHSASMTKIINDLRASVPPRLRDAVHGVDGTPADLAILLAGIVESTMRRAIKPHLHDEFLREVAKVVATDEIDLEQVGVRWAAAWPLIHLFPLYIVSIEIGYRQGIIPVRMTRASMAGSPGNGPGRLSSFHGIEFSWIRAR